MVRTNVNDSSQADLKALQKTQNKLLRLLNGTKIFDKISTSSLLTNLNMISVNQFKVYVTFGIGHMVWIKYMSPLFNFVKF